MVDGCLVQVKYGGKTWRVLILCLQDTATPVALQQSLVEECRNELTFSDGDVFRFYRLAQTTGDHQNKKRWLARLSPGKRKIVLQLHKVCDGQLFEAFDILRPFVGLWQHFHFGALKRALPMHMWHVSHHNISISPRAGLIPRYLGDDPVSHAYLRTVASNPGWHRSCTSDPTSSKLLTSQMSGTFPVR